MNFIEKTQVKMLTILELSEDIEKTFEAKAQSIQRLLGELKGIAEAAQKVEGTHQRVDRVFSDGQGGDPPAGEDPMTPEERQLIKRWINVAVAPLRKFLSDKQAELERSHGEYQILDKMLEVFKRKHDKFQSDVDLVLKHEETGEPIPLRERPAGVRPEDPMAERKRESAEETQEGTPDLPTTTSSPLVCECGKECISLGGLKRHQRACKLSQGTEENTPAETEDASNS